MVNGACRKIVHLSLIAGIHARPVYRFDSVWQGRLKLE